MLNFYCLKTHNSCKGFSEVYTFLLIIAMCYQSIFISYHFVVFIYFVVEYPSCTNHGLINKRTKGQTSFMVKWFNSFSTTRIEYLFFKVSLMFFASTWDTKAIVVHSLKDNLVMTPSILSP